MPSTCSHVFCILQRYQLRVGSFVLICPKGRFPTDLEFSQPDRSIFIWPGFPRFRDIKAPAGRVRIPHDFKPSTVTEVQDDDLRHAPQVPQRHGLPLPRLCSEWCVCSLCVGGAEVTDCLGSCARPPCYLSEWEERLEREVLRSVPHPRGHPSESIRSWRMRRRGALGPAYLLSRRHWVFHDEKGSVCCFPSSPFSPENDAAFKPGAVEPMVPFTLSPRRNSLIMRTKALMRSSRARNHSSRNTRTRLHRVTCESYNVLRDAGPLACTHLAFSSPLPSV